MTFLVKRFAQLDHVLTPRDDRWQMRQVQRHRCQALASHHFLIKVAADIRIDGGSISSKNIRYDLNVLRQDSVKDHFSNRFADLSRDNIADLKDCDKLVNWPCNCFDRVASAALQRWKSVL